MSNLRKCLYSFISQAICECYRSTFSYRNGSEFKIGSVVIDSKTEKIVSRGHNEKCFNDVI